jgi:HPr kinase/phosphorylase
MKKILTVRELKENLNLTSITRDSFLEKKVKSSYFSTGGLEIANFFNFFIPGNIICYGKNEVAYLNSLAPDIGELVLKKIFLLQPSCIITSAPSFSLPSQMVPFAHKYGVPILLTEQNYYQLVTSLDFFLTRFFAPEKVVHGTMMEVFGAGVLLLGDSGSGKSECALELVKRGHRLISDDTVILKKLEGGIILGTGHELTRHHMELRGIGIINIKSLFGVGAILEEKALELVVKFEPYDPVVSYDRLGIDEDFFQLFGVKIPQKTIPVTSGKNLSILVETAALNQHLKVLGENTPKLFLEKIEEQMLQERNSYKSQE